MGLNCCIYFTWSDVMNIEKRDRMLAFVGDLRRTNVFGSGSVVDAYATAILSVVNAHQRCPAAHASGLRL
jgi:hypothetical protein